jgi:hypothetical protein
VAARLCNFLSKLCTEEFANNSFDDDHDGEGVRENDGSEAVLVSYLSKR